MIGCHIIVEADFELKPLTTSNRKSVTVFDVGIFADASVPCAALKTAVAIPHTAGASS